MTILVIDEARNCLVLLKLLIGKARWLVPPHLTVTPFHMIPSQTVFFLIIVYCPLGHSPMVDKTCEYLL
jgi:hypothetical protein